MTSFHHLGCPSCGSVSAVERRCVTFLTTLSLPSLDHQGVWHCHYSTQSQVVTLSHFLGCGKKSAWQSTPGLTNTFVALTSEPQELSPQSQHMRTLERFVVVMYSKGCGLERVNEAKLRLFTSGKKTLEALPPTQAALYQHIRRAMLQASFWSHE